MRPRNLSTRLSKGALTGEGASRSCVVNQAAGEQDAAGDVGIAAVLQGGSRDTNRRRS